MEAIRELVHVEAPDAAVVAEEARPLLAAAEAMIVNNRETHAVALVKYAELKTVIRRVTEHYEPTRAALDKAKKELLRARDSIIEPIDTAARVLSSKIGNYELNERRRIEAERRQAEEEQNRKLLEERLKRAAEADAAGETEQADKILEAPVPPPTIVEPLKQTAEIKGISAPREIWRAEVIDDVAFLEWACANKQIGFLDVNQSALNAEARKLKDALEIPGVKPVCEIIRAVRR